MALRFMRRRRNLSPGEPETPAALKPARPGSTVVETIKTHHEFDGEEPDGPEEPNGPDTLEDPPVDDYTGPPFLAPELEDLTTEDTTPPVELPDGEEGWGPLPGGEEAPPPSLADQMNEAFAELEEPPAPAAIAPPQAPTVPPPLEEHFDPRARLEDRLLAGMKLGTGEEWASSIEAGRALQVLDWTIYKVHALDADLKEKKRKWKEFLARLQASIDGFLSGRENALTTSQELLKYRLLQLHELGVLETPRHDTPGGVRATLVKPGLSSIKVDVDTGPLYQDGQLAAEADTWPFVTVKREFVVNKPALKAWIKDRVDARHKADKTDEDKARRLAIALELLNELPICTASMPTYGLKLTPRGFDPLTQLGHYLGEDNATEILDGVFALEEGDDHAGAE